MLLSSMAESIVVTLNECATVTRNSINITSLLYKDGRYNQGKVIIVLFQVVQRPDKQMFISNQSLVLQKVSHPIMISGYK